MHQEEATLANLSALEGGCLELEPLRTPSGNRRSWNIWPLVMISPGEDRDEEEYKGGTRRECAALRAVLMIWPLAGVEPSFGGRYLVHERCTWEDLAAGSLQWRRQGTDQTRRLTHPSLVMICFVMAWLWPLAPAEV